MKIGFVTDTNFLKKKDEKLIKHTNYLDYINYFFEYIEILEKSDNKSKLIYYMPEIILEELYFQRIEVFNQKYEQLKEDYQEISHSIIGEIPYNNIEKTALEEKEKYKNSQFCKILKLDTNKELLDELIKEALAKKAPFDKTIDDQKTDSGFKDALIWKTILYSKEIDQCEKLYFFSCDQVFKESEMSLKEEFERYHPNVQCIIKYYEPKGNQRQNALNLMIEENDLIKTDVVKLYNKELLLEFIKELKYKSKEDIIMYGITDSEENIILSNILFEKFVNNDFYINNVKKNELNYKVTIYFKTFKYETNPKSFIFNTRRYVFGKIELVFENNEEKFKLIDNSISNIKFMETSMERMLNTIKKQQEIFRKCMEPIEDSLNSLNYLKKFSNILSTEMQFQQQLQLQNRLSYLYDIKPSLLQDEEIEDNEENG